MQRQLISLTLAGIVGFTTATTAAQTSSIVPDTTLGNENSIVIPDVTNLNRITGGATRGSNLFHSFNGFSIGTNQTAWFDNTLSIQNILVRITGSNRSDIDGTIHANGDADLFLLNPNGFIFGPNARLDIGGSFSVLTSKGIPLGETAVFSAISPDQNQLLAIKPNVFFNLTPPQADIQLDSNLAVKTGQSITLWGDTVRFTGKLNAPSGQVRIFGDRIGLFDNAQIDTSSETSGGQVFIGGEYQGKGNLPKATATYISPNTVVRSNAIRNGNGGQIIVWSENSTKAYGSFSANGGQASGNGGLIETSSRNALDTTGIQIDATAKQGLPGTWLLDPHDVILSYGGAWKDKFTGNQTKIFIPESESSVVNIAAIGEFLNAGNNVTIRTSSEGNQQGNIINETPGSADKNFENKGFGIDKKEGVPVTLTFQAHNDIRLGSIVKGEGFGIKDLTNTGNSLNVILEADIDQDGRGSIIIEKGGFELRGGRFEARASEQINIRESGIKSQNISNSLAPPIRLSAPIVTFNSGGITTATKSSGDGASIIVQTSKLDLNGAGFNTTTTGNGNAGDILIAGKIDGSNQVERSSDVIQLQNSGIASRTGVAVNAGGDLPQVEIGNQKISFDDNKTDLFLGDLRSETRGKAGNINIYSDRLALLGGAGINNSSFSQGDAGSTYIQSRDVLVANKSGIDGRTAVAGKGADIRINALDGTLTILNSSGINSRSYGLAADRPSLSTAQSGNVTITVERLKMESGGGIDSNAGYSDVSDKRIVYANTKGGAGNITVTADHFDANGGSGIRSETAGEGNAGLIKLTVNQDLQLTNNSNISTGTFKGSTGKGGQIIANVGSLSIGNNQFYKPDTNKPEEDPTKRSGGFSSASIGTGDAGDIDLTVRDRLTIDNALNNSKVSDTEDNRAGIRLSSEQTGKGGTLTLTANQIKLNNAFISVKSNQSTAGDIRLTVPGLILLRNGSEISATAGNRQNPGNGGDIAISTPLIVAIAKENSDITSDAFSGNGGRITINADNLIGILFRPKATPLSDITASSERGNQGTVTLNTPDIDPSRGLTVLPTVPIDVAQKIDRTCNPNADIQSSSFVTRGTGGLPASPSTTIGPNGFIRLAQSPTDRQTSQAPSPIDRAPIPVEAQQSLRLVNGKIRFQSQTQETGIPNARSGCFTTDPIAP